MFAEIVSIGSELLTPDRIDTNSLWITAQLNALGIEVRRKVIWGDEVVELGAEIRHSLKRSPVVITTGGLGPTEDDVTREAVSWAIEAPLETRGHLVDELQARFVRFGRPMTANNLKQCLVPVGATVLPNPNGTAVGLHCQGDSLLFVMPGPPREMKPMFTNHVIPRLRTLVGQRRVLRHTLHVIGLGESALDERIAPIYTKLDNPKVGILFSALDVEIHLTATASSEAEAQALNEALAARLRQALGHHVYSESESTLAQVVGDLLEVRGESLAIVDVATGGLVAQRLAEAHSNDTVLRVGMTFTQRESANAWLSAPGSADIQTDARDLALALRERTGAQHALALLSEACDATDAGFQKFVIALASDAPQLTATVFPGETSTRMSRAAQGALDLMRRSLEGHEP